MGLCIHCSHIASFAYAIRFQKGQLRQQLPILEAGSRRLKLYTAYIHSYISKVVFKLRRVRDKFYHVITQYISDVFIHLLMQHRGGHPGRVQLPRSEDLRRRRDTRGDSG
jgi:hypothetical protein